MEDRSAGNERVGSGFCKLGYVFQIDSPVYFNPEVGIISRAPFTEMTNFLERPGNEFLATESRDLPTSPALYPPYPGLPKA